MVHRVCVHVTLTFGFASICQYLEGLGTSGGHAQMGHMLVQETVPRDGRPLRRTALGHQVRDALLHLSEPAYLEIHPLRAALPAGPNGEAPTLRAVLADCIGRLQPPPTSRSSRSRRCHDLLRLRYLEGYSVEEVCEALGISLSEFYRTHRQGLDALVAMLGRDLQPGSASHASAPASGWVAEPPGAVLALPKRSPLVGRQATLRTLADLYATVAASGCGAVLLLAGEQGIGKTRLAEELGAYALARGGVFLRGRFPRQSLVPYDPWIEALQAGLGRLSPEAAAEAVGPFRRELASIMPELRDAVGQELPGRTDLHEQRRALYDGVVRVLSHVARAGPVVLLLDDLHWSRSLRLMLHVAQRLDHLPLLLVGTLREDELNDKPPLVRDLAEVRRTGHLTQVRLEPLTPAETERLVESYFGPAVSSEISCEVHDSTRGNPLFIEEVLRSLVETGVVEQQDGAWSLQARHTIALPASVKTAIQDRVTALGTPALEALRHGAVLGQQFSFQELAAFTGMPEPDLVAGLERAIAARLLVDRSTRHSEVYAFADEQVHDVLYASLSSPRRRHMHRRALAVLEELYGPDADDRLERLAHHAVEGGDAVKGARYSLRAGQRAEAVFSWERAASWYHTALDLLEEIDAPAEQRVSVLERLGEMHHVAVLGTESGLPYLERALELCERHGLAGRVAVLHRLLARERMYSPNVAQTDFAQALEHLATAEHALSASGPSSDLGLVYVTQARAHAAMLQLSAAVCAADRAADIARHLGNNALAAEATLVRALARVYAGDTSGWETALEDVWQVAVEHHLPMLADSCRAAAVAISGAQLKNPRAGLAWAERPPVFATQLTLVDIPTNLIGVNAMRGDLQRAEELFLRQQAHSQPVGRPIFGRFPTSAGLLLLRQGRWTDARRVLEEGVAWARRAHHLSTGVLAARRLAEACMETGALAQAATRLRWALEVATGSGARLFELGALPYLAELHLRQGDHSAAAGAVARAHAVLAAGGDWGGLPAEVCLAEAKLHEARGQAAQADACFAHALEINQALDLAWDEAKVRYEWARALLGRPEPAAEAQARALLAAARALWDHQGAVGYAERCARLLTAA